MSLKINETAIQNFEPFQGIRLWKEAGLKSLYLFSLGELRIEIKQEAFTFIFVPQTEV